VTSSSFAKRARDQAKKAKADAKRQRRQAAGQAPSPEDTVEAPTPMATDGLSSADLLGMLEEIHRLHDEGSIADEDFQLKKAELLSRLPVD
jgi:hypothetical protein